MKIKNEELYRVQKYTKKWGFWADAGILSGEDVKGMIKGMKKDIEDENWVVYSRGMTMVDITKA